MIAAFGGLTRAALPVRTMVRAEATGGQLALYGCPNLADGDGAPVQ